VGPILSDGEAPPIPLQPRDWRFILAGFGLANAGIGIAVARLVSKLFFV
jgi:hypothetical protein